MKIKNRFLIFLGIFIFMIIPKNVFAKEIYPYAIGMNNVNFTNSSMSYNNNVNSNAIAPNSSFTLMIGMDSFDYYGAYGVPEIHEGFSYYPYTLIYFQTWNSPNQIGITKNTSCNASCFGSDNVTLKQIGKDAISGRNRYVLILENKKWSTNAPANLQGSWVYHIDDQITFTNLYTGGNRGFIFYQVLLTDDTSILTNDSIDIDKMISNANNNTMQIKNAISSIQSDVNQKFRDLDASNKQQTQQVITNQNNNQAQTNQRLDNVNNSLNSEEAPTNNDVSNKANEWTSKLAGTGPVSNMVLMPITLLNGYVSGLNATCSPYNLGNLMGTDIILPCINISNYVGVSLWNVIDVLFSGFMIYAIGKKFVKIFNDFTNLRDNQMDDLYGGGK